MTDQRIKLAEFIEWGKSDDRQGWSGVIPCWFFNDHDRDFDPRNDANDCEALIRKLNDKNIDVNVWHSGNAQHRCNVPYRVTLWGCATMEKREWAGDDWKHGVCDLAEKIIEQQEDGDD